MVQIRGSAERAVVGTTHLDLPGLPPQQPPPAAAPARPEPAQVDKPAEPATGPAATNQAPLQDLHPLPCEVCRLPVAVAYIARTGRALHKCCESAASPTAPEGTHA